MSECKRCIHEKVCGVKKVMEETNKQIVEQKLSVKHPYIEVEVKCTKWEGR